MFEGLREVHWGKPTSLDVDKILQAPRLKRLYIYEASIGVLPNVIFASRHPSAIVHVKAFSGYISPYPSAPPFSLSWDVYGLENCLREQKGSFDWTGTVLLKGDGPPSASQLEDIQKMGTFFRHAGQGIRRVILGGSACSFFPSSCDDVRLLSQAMPDVSELEVRKQNCKPCALKWVLEAFPIDLLLLRKSDLELVRHLRAMRTKKKLIPRGDSLYVKVIPGAERVP